MTDDDRIADPTDKVTYPTVPADQNGHVLSQQDIGQRVNVIKRMDQGQEAGGVAVYVGRLTGFEYIPTSVHQHNLNETNNGNGPIVVKADESGTEGMMGGDVPEFLRGLIGKAVGADEDGNVMHSDPEHLTLYLDSDRIINLAPSAHTWVFEFFDEDFGL